MSRYRLASRHGNYLVVPWHRSAIDITSMALSASRGGYRQPSYWRPPSAEIVEMSGIMTCCNRRPGAILIDNLVFGRATGGGCAVAWLVMSWLMLQSGNRRCNSRRCRLRKSRIASSVPHRAAALFVLSQWHRIGAFSRYRPRRSHAAGTVTQGYGRIGLSDSHAGTAAE